MDIAGFSFAVCGIGARSAPYSAELSNYTGVVMSGIVTGMCAVWWAMVFRRRVRLELGSSSTEPLT